MFQGILQKKLIKKSQLKWKTQTQILSTVLTFKTVKDVYDTLKP